MSELREQLEALRERVARVNARYATAAAAVPALQREVPSARGYIESTLAGEEVETSVGKHFETERLFQAHHRHGSADIGALSDLPRDLFALLSEGVIPEVPPSEW